MFEEERKIHILNKLNEQKSATIDELSKIFKVSASTIRRDLSSMENSGLVKRTHGGVILVDTVKSNLSYSDKATKNYDLKLAIAKKAASLIQDNQIIALNTSTITTLLAGNLKAKNLTVVTNSLSVLNVLKDRSDYKLIALGGVFMPSSQSYEGPTTISQINSLHFDTVFYGVNGIDLEFGISSTSEIDASGKLAMIKRSNNNYVLCENLKFDKCSLFKISNLDYCTGIITDELIDSDTVKKYITKVPLILSEIEK